jgi:uncharacterized protein
MATLAPATHGSTTQIQCNLGTRLYKARWTFEYPLENYTLLYSPDAPGMPVLVETHVKELLNLFRDGRSVGDVIAQGSCRDMNFVQLLRTVNDLFDRGFLREQPDPDRFVPKRNHPSRRAMNIWVHINNYCNLACSYCFVEHTKIHMRDETIARTVQLIGQTVRKNGVEDVLVKFAGGEPTLTLQQMELFQRSLTLELEGTGAFVHYTVLTNGTNLNERFLRFIESAHATVSISVDGYGEYHDLYRVFRKPTNREAVRRPRRDRLAVDELFPGEDLCFPSLHLQFSKYQ